MEVQLPMWPPMTPWRRDLVIAQWRQKSQLPLHSKTTLVGVLNSLLSLVRLEAKLPLSLANRAMGTFFSFFSILYGWSIGFPVLLSLPFFDFWLRTVLVGTIGVSDILASSTPSLAYTGQKEKHRRLTIVSLGPNRPSPSFLSETSYFCFIQNNHFSFFFFFNLNCSGRNKEKCLMKLF